MSQCVRVRGGGNCGGERVIFLLSVFANSEVRLGAKLYALRSGSRVHTALCSSFGMVVPSSPALRGRALLQAAGVVQVFPGTGSREMGVRGQVL